MEESDGADSVGGPEEDGTIRESESEDKLVLWRHRRSRRRELERRVALPALLSPLPLCLRHRRRSLCCQRLRNQSPLDALDSLLLLVSDGVARPARHALSGCDLVHAESVSVGSAV